MLHYSCGARSEHRFSDIERHRKEKEKIWKTGKKEKLGGSPGFPFLRMTASTTSSVGRHWNRGGERGESNGDIKPSPKKRQKEAGGELARE